MNFYDLSAHLEWSGEIVQLRFDPISPGSYL
jgi:hypothetical protein